MSFTKKLLSGTVALLMLSGTAYANELNVQLNLGQPAPVYAEPVYAPPPVVVAPSPAYVVAPWGEGYDPHHRRHNYRYWREHHHYDHYDHHDDQGHWDHR